MLSTQLVPASGLRGLLGAREVEIAAAIEREMSEVRHPVREDRHDAQAAPAPGADLVARLCAAGFTRTTAEDIAKSYVGRRRHRGATPAAVREAVSAWAGTLLAPDTQSRVQVFVGPPGAGKTTTIAKIAAQVRVQSGQRLGLIAADGFRVGAVEQLRLYADIIGSPFVAARTSAEVDRALIGSTTPVLVDTAGRSGSDRATGDLLSTLSGSKGVRVHLVIPATSTERDLVRVLEAHAPRRPDAVVLTRTDEADSIGTLAGVLRERGLPVSYLGTGQRVPDDLLRPTPAHLAAAMLGEFGSDAWSVA